MPTLRDVIIRQEQKFNAKKDEPIIFRAVLCDCAGLTTGSGSVWADSDERLVWYRPLGVTNAGQVRCVRLEPQLGLGVLVGVPDGSNELEVIMDDPFLRRSGSGQSYLAPNGRDFEPGGRLQMWLYPEAFVPLATLAGSGLSVTVVAGDYEDYQGVRQTFAGSVNFDISSHQPAGPTEHCLVGIYISSAGAIGSVAGATVATSATAPEPAWPAGSVRLAVVDLDDTQTTINFSADIDNRRLYFPYPGSGAILKTFLDAKGDLITATADDTPAILTVGIDGYVLTADSGEAKGIKWAEPASGWPYPKVHTVSSSGADFTSLATAIANAGVVTGDVIEIGEDISETSITLNKAITVRGVSPEITLTITTSASGLNITAANARVENLRVVNTTTDTNVNAVLCDPTSGAVTLENVIVVGSGGTNRRGINVNSGTADLINCDGLASGGAGSDNGLVVTAGTANVYGGRYSGDSNALLTVGTARLFGPQLTGTISNSSTISGFVLDDKGRDCGALVKNTSGGAVTAGAIGYIDEVGEFKTTTTAGLVANWHVVTIGGASSGWIFAKRAGNATVTYTSTAPNAGEYLTTSTSGGDALATATMAPGVFAVCLAGGSGGTVETLLLCNTARRVFTNANDTVRINGLSSTDFVATINGAPSGTSVVYNAPSSGAANTINVASSSQAGKIVLYNTTRGTSALISSVNTGTNTITLTATVPAGWASGDTITTRSQTATGAVDTGVYLYELDLSGLSLGLARQIELAISHSESAAAGANYLLVHPFEAVTGAFSTGDFISAAANIFNSKEAIINVKSGKICFGCHASGSGTSSVIIRVRAIDVAEP